MRLSPDVLIDYVYKSFTGSEGPKMVNESISLHTDEALSFSVQLKRVNEIDNGSDMLNPIVLGCRS